MFREVPGTREGLNTLVMKLCLEGGFLSDHIAVKCQRKSCPEDPTCLFLELLELGAGGGGRREGGSVQDCVTSRLISTSEWSALKFGDVMPRFLEPCQEFLSFQFPEKRIALHGF